MATWLRGYAPTRLRGYVVRVRVSYPYAPIPNSNFNSKWLRGYVATRLALTVTLTLSGYVATRLALTVTLTLSGYAAT